MSAASHIEIAFASLLLRLLLVLRTVAGAPTPSAAVDEDQPTTSNTTTTTYSSTQPLAATMAYAVVPAGWMLAAALGPIGIASTVYLVRKMREFQWGWVRNRYALDGRVYVITGANTGLGWEAARDLAARNATVIMACRSAERAEAAIARIRQQTGKGNLVFIPLDLSDFASVRRFATQLLTLYPRFDCLINNAGMTMHVPTATADARFELSWATNHLGPFLLTRQLDAAIRANNTRVVWVASTLHKRGRIDFDHLGQVDASVVLRPGRNEYYNNSKLANFYVAREMYRRGYDAHVLCPGLCHTDFFRDYSPRWYHYVMFAPVVWLALRSAEQGAQNIVWCATDSENTEAKNPAKGWYVRSLKQDKSPYEFADEVGERLWRESEKAVAEVEGGKVGAEE